jgi:cytoskeleton protein RodZ
LKLAPRQVKALEDEDFAHLPGRTFTRGFVRNYARLLNLDADDLLALMPDARQAPALDAPALHSTGAMIAELPSSEDRGPSLTRWLIPLVLVACVIAAAGYEWYRGALTSPEEAARVSSAKASPAASTAAQLPTTSSTSSTPLPNPLGEASKVESATAVASPASPAPTPGAAASPPASPAPTPGAAASSAQEDATDVATKPPSADEAPAPLQLVYSGPSWTEVRDRDGQVLIARLVPPGSEQAIRGAAPFDVVIGNAAVVWLSYRGKPIDLAPYTRQNVARLRLS